MFLIHISVRSVIHVKADIHGFVIINETTIP